MKENTEKNTFPPPAATEMEVPEGIDRRTFLMRHAVIGAAMLITGCEK